MGTKIKIILSIFNLRSMSIALIIINIFLASRWIIDGNLFFHTDIARDFLLIEDIVDNRHLALIGPRSGAIPGLFHGPLWLYLNAPSFILGQGNPVVVGWFWVILYIASLYSIYWVGKKMFGEKEGILSALLLSVTTILYIRSLFNPYGSLILAPLFFYLFYRYVENNNWKTLILSFFILGLIIQFQMAFGIPILLLSILWLVVQVFRSGKVTHLLSTFILIIPLSSFLIFDLRNNFLQFNSVLNYIFGNESHGKMDIDLSHLFMLRIKESIIDGIGLVSQNNIYLTYGLLLIIIYVGFILLKRKIRTSYFLFFYFYFGFWILTTLFKGPVWSYYYFPFIPLLILSFISLKKYLNKYVFYSFFTLVYLVNLNTVVLDLKLYNDNPIQQDVSTWKFNQSVAKQVFSSNETEFGYFIFTPDLYGYSPRYALNYYQKQNIKSVFPYQKKSVTYLVVAPPPFYGKDPNSIWYQKNTNSDKWKEEDLKIIRDPDETVNYENGVVVEKYYLSAMEQLIQANPFLIQGIFFR
ncbi:MAG: glycosyltransferase family 39 protein [Candidatus Daviesbacteria bacterium]|nr:glycosyltransferase family 39 protein [Candidatus Daviesbacteria bacterium]